MGAAVMPSETDQPSAGYSCSGLSRGPCADSSAFSGSNACTSVPTTGPASVPFGTSFIGQTVAPLSRIPPTTALLQISHPGIAASSASTHSCPRNHQSSAGTTANKVQMPGPLVAREMAVGVDHTLSSGQITNKIPKSVKNGPLQGPPTFGLPSASPPTSATLRSHTVANAPLPSPTLQGIASSQGRSPAITAYTPTAMSQVPGSRTRSGSQFSPYSQNSIPLPVASDGRSIPSPLYQNPYQSVRYVEEDFCSLSITTSPGTRETTIDPSSLPRPSGRAEDLSPSSSKNCHSRYLRTTSGLLPSSQGVASRWHLPMGAVVHPLAEAPTNEEVPVIDLRASGIARCHNCRAYVNPYVVFSEYGRIWRCNLCTSNNEVPLEYYCPLDRNGRRKDANERPELCRGSVEFIAPSEYMVRPSMPPVYFFLIDVSASAIRNGMLQVAVDTIKSCLDKLPGYPRTRIGFLTFDSSLHFYCLKSSLMQPRMMVVADLDDPFLPVPDGLLVNLSESRAVVEILLNSLPSMFEENASVESATGPALRAVLMIMNEVGGKLLLFQSSLPSLGIGHLRIRGDDPRIYGSEKEPSLRNPGDPFYKQMAADFSKFQISVSLYAFAHSYIDLASLGALAKYTAGQVFFYPFFQSLLSGEKFSYELVRDLTRETAWEAELRIRCGKGMRITAYRGHFFLRSSDLMSLPALDCDKAFAVQLAVGKSLSTYETAYFQAALLYTSSNGQRRIRVHTLAVPLTSDLKEVYRSADIGAIITLLSRTAVEKSLATKLEDVHQECVESKLVQALKEFRNLLLRGAQHSVAERRLILPESLKLLPLYGLSLLKCVALRKGHTGATLDEQVFACFEMMVMSVPRLLSYLYPTMFRVDEYLMQGGEDVMMLRPLPLTAESLDSSGVFLVNNGLRFIVWFGSLLTTELGIQLFGAEAVCTSADMKRVSVSERNNSLSHKFMRLLRGVRARDPAAYPQCLLVRQGDQPREGFLLLFNLVEDGVAGSMGYAEWLRRIYDKLNVIVSR